jgi:hypothetical protein
MIGSNGIPTSEASVRSAEADLIGLPNKATLRNTLVEEVTIVVEIREGGLEYHEPEEFFDQYV